MVSVYVAKPRAHQGWALWVLPVASDPIRPVPLRIFLRVSVRTHWLSVPAFTLIAALNLAECLLLGSVHSCPLSLQGPSCLSRVCHPIGLFSQPSNSLLSFAIRFDQILL